jgi:predicted permease
MERLLQDLKYALRTLAQQRAFTLAAVLALALGIGATTAVFTVVDAVVLRPFPFPNPDGIVVFMNAGQGGENPSASPAKYEHWREQTSVVQDVTAYRSEVLNYAAADVPQQIQAVQASEPIFRLFGAHTLIGRTYSPQENSPGGPRVVVLSYGWWQRAFAGDPKIVGRTILLSGDPYVVVGVLANGLDLSDFGDTPDVFVPFQLDPNSPDRGHYFMAFGRVKPGVTLAQAQAELEHSADAYRRKFPNAIGPKAGFTVEPLSKAFSRNSKQIFVVLSAAVLGVLLIACANVANLLLVRATVRQREMAIRAAVGAGTGRIVRQLLTESVLLGIFGGVLGIILGIVGIRWLLSINTAGLPRLGEHGGLVHLDGRVLAFALGISILTGIVFGIVPAIQAARTDLNGTLREGSGGGGGGRRATLRSALVVLEIALAVMLVVGSGLLIRTSLALRAVNPGFDVHNVLTMEMSLTGPRFQTSASVAQLVRDGVDRLNRTPNVVMATASCCLPLEGGFGLPFKIVGQPTGNGPWLGGGAWTTVSPGYFETFKIPVLRGRSFTDRDDAGATPVVIINQAMAKQFWKTRDPLSDQLVIGRGIMKEFANEPARQVIGVVADSRDGGLNQDPQPKMFIPEAQQPDAVAKLNNSLAPMVWIVRTRVPPLSLATAVQQQLREATGLPVTAVRSMDQVVAASTSRDRFNTLLMSVFAVSALALAAIGIYGVMAYSVQQRTREIGVRLALGAAPGGLRTMIVFQGMRLALVGVALGLAAAYLGVRYMSSMLYGVEARDPVVFIGVPLLLAVVALLAIWLPAGRASRVDPLGALRAAYKPEQHQGDGPLDRRTSAPSEVPSP